jgi:hypothetical protein
MKIKRFKHISIFAMYWKLTEKSGFYFFGGEIWGLENSRKLIFTRKKPTN